MADELEIALGKRFLARRDVKAVQFKDGHYEPERQPWKMADLRAHVAGERSLGHYLVSAEGKVNLFAFDVDLTTTGYWIPLNEQVLEPQQCNPREVWLEPNHPGKEFLFFRLRTTAEVLGMKIHNLTDGEVHVAISYSGSKGLHVYGFLPEPTPAADARTLAFGILKSVNNADGSQGYVQSKGENFWTPTNETQPNLEIEVFPKQESVSDLGNLMRLPLGVNRKTGQRSFFLDCRCPYTQIRSMEPLDALGGVLPWD